MVADRKAGHSFIPNHVFPTVEGGGFEPPKAEPADLQSAPFGRSGTPPSSIDSPSKRVFATLGHRLIGSDTDSGIAGEPIAAGSIIGR